MGCIYRIRKLFGVCSGDFDLFKSDDKILVPCFANPASLTMAHWTRYKNGKMRLSMTLSFVHFYTEEEPNPTVVEYLQEFCRKRKQELILQRVNPVTTRDELLQLFADEAVKRGCNKFAVPDSLDYIDAYLVGHMATHGELNGLPILQPMTSDGQEVSLIRPLSLISEEELKLFAEKQGYLNIPSSLDIPEEPEITIAREAINVIYDKAANTRMNIFNSQFGIQEKYLGIGEGIEQDEGSNSPIDLLI